MPDFVFCHVLIYYLQWWKKNSDPFKQKHQYNVKMLPLQVQVLHCKSQLSKSTEVLKAKYKLSIKTMIK